MDGAYEIIEWGFQSAKFPTVVGKVLSDSGALQTQSGEESSSSDEDE